MKSLLFLVHRIPFPPNKGDKIRSFHFLQALAKNFDVYLGTFIDDPQDGKYVDTVKQYCRESCFVELEPRVAKITSLQGLLTGQALSLPYYRSAKLRHWVAAVVAEKQIDTVLIFSSPMAQFVMDNPRIKLYADFVDVDSDKWRQYAEKKPWPTKLIYRREARRLLAFEKQIARQAVKTLFVSEREAELFKTLAPESSERIGFVNNGVNIDYFNPNASYPAVFSDAEPTVVFTGAMDYWANIDAVQWFADKVFPLIKKQYSNAKFYIVGSKPSKTVLELAKQEGVTVTGSVDDVRPYVAHADVVVAPLRIARGIQNKVLEAMALGKTVVASGYAAEGIPLHRGLDVKIADDADDYAQQVIAVLEQGNAERVSKENRAFVEAHFSWEKSARELCKLLNNEI
jgi:sugar transferase (PEP-CTERM/EpsH1 system associated)